MRAITQADLVVFGPGSWYTSVLPHLLVPSIRTALTDSAAHRVVVVNLAGESGETEGYPSDEYLAAWARLFPDIGIDTVLADANHVDDPARLQVMADQVGANLVSRDVARGSVHDPGLLAQALRDLLARLKTGGSA